jgi:hypothetical protein
MSDTSGTSRSSAGPSGRGRSAFHKCGRVGQRGGGELIHTVVAEGELGGGIAAKRSLPRRDISFRLIGVVELVEDAGGTDAVSKVGEGLEPSAVIKLPGDSILRS